MASSGGSSSQELRYPPVQVNHLLTDLDLGTLMMKSTRQNIQEAGSSLDESTYELLSDSLFETSDDEAHTASIASTNDPTSDDTSTFSDDCSDFEDYEGPSCQNVPLAHTAAQRLHFTSPSTNSADESTLTERPAQSITVESWEITMDEQVAEQPGFVHGSKIVKSLPEQDDKLPQVLNQYKCAQVRLVVRAILSEHPMPTPDHYKILFIGEPEKWLEDIVTSQVSAALVASPIVSKSVVVDGQVAPYSPVITKIRSTGEPVLVLSEGSSYVRVVMEDGQKLEIGLRASSLTHDEPDLIVFCYANSEPESLGPVRKLLDHRNTPYLHLTQTRPYGSGSSSYDGTSLRVCIEGRDHEDHDYNIKEVLPVDFFTFSQLAPLQLNRHLVHISPHLTRRKVAKKSSSMRDAFNIHTKEWNKRLLIFKVLLPVLLLGVIFPAFLHGVAYIPRIWQTSQSLHTQLIVSPQASMSVSHKHVPTSNPGSTGSTQYPPISRTISPALDLVPSDPKLLSNKQGNENLSRAGGFDIQILGPHSFVLTPIKYFMKARRRAQLQVQVSRNGRVVPIQYNRTDYGEYLVDLIKEYTLGDFNVSIVTLAKPSVHSSFQVKLGHDMSRLTLLLTTATKTVVRQKEYLEDIASERLENLRARLIRLSSKSIHLKNDIHTSKKELDKRVHTIVRILHKQVAGRVELMKHAPETVWRNVRGYTAPVRTSTAMRKARMNALRIRCRLEKAAGLSGSCEYENSWACSRAKAGDKMKQK